MVAFKGCHIPWQPWHRLNTGTTWLQTQMVTGYFSEAVIVSMCINWIGYWIMFIRGVYCRAIWPFIFVVPCFPVHKHGTGRHELPSLVSEVMILVCLVVSFGESVLFLWTLSLKSRLDIYWCCLVGQFWAHPWFDSLHS